MRNKINTLTDNEKKTHRVVVKYETLETVIFSQFLMGINSKILK